MTDLTHRPVVEMSGEVSVSCSVDADRLRVTLTAAAAFLSKDAARPILEAVAVDFVDGAVRFVATDSHRLAVFCMAADVSGAMVDGPVLVPRDAVRSILAAVKPAAVKHSPGPARFTFGADSCAFDNGAGAVLTFRPVEGEYPNWSGLIPDVDNWPEDANVAVSLSPKYLADIGKAFATLTAGTAVPVRLRFQNDRRPVLFTASSVNLWPAHVPDPVAILMPVRIH